MNKFIKDQIGLLKPSATLAINEESEKLKRSGKKVYKFGFGQSRFPIPEYVVSAFFPSSIIVMRFRLLGSRPIGDVIVLSGGFGTPETKAV